MQPPVASTCSGRTVLQLHLEVRTPIARYEFISALGPESSRGHDPTGWVFGVLHEGGVDGGKDKGTFEVLNTVTGAVPPDAASSSYGHYYAIRPTTPPLPPQPPAALHTKDPRGLRIGTQRKESSRRLDDDATLISSQVYQFVFTSTRDASSTVVSLAEVMLFDEHGVQVPVLEASNPGGEAGNALETAASAIDGNVNNKWLDVNFHNESILQLELGSSRHVAQYELWTPSGRWRKRDPTGWLFGMVREANVFELLSDVTDVVPPGVESTSYGRFSAINHPPVSPPPLSPPAPLSPPCGSPRPPPTPPQSPPAPTGDLYEFVFTSVKDASSTLLSLAEVTLYDSTGAQVPVREAHNPGGAAGNIFETPQSAIDGVLNNKWLDTNFYGESRLQLDIAESTHVAQYELFTAKGRHRARDPTGWMFGIRRVGDEGESTFELLSEVLNVVPPNAESTSYGRFPSIQPPPTSPSPPPATPPSPDPPRRRRRHAPQHHLHLPCHQDHLQFRRRPRLHPSARCTSSSS